MWNYADFNVLLNLVVLSARTSVLPVDLCWQYILRLYPALEKAVLLVLTAVPGIILETGVLPLLMYWYRALANDWYSSTGALEF